MTQLHKEYIRCPRCLNEEYVTVWDVIDLAQDPYLKEEVLQKDVQQFECSNCQARWVAAKPFVYHDPELRLLFYYCPQFEALLEQGPTEDRSLPEAIQEALPADWVKLSHDYQLRLVPSYNDLIEKIHTADYGLDDRLIEVLKIALRTRRLDDPSQDPWEEIHFLSATKEQLLFSTFTPAEDWQAVTLDMAAYANARQMLTALLPPEGRWSVINDQWASDFVKRHNPGT